MNNVNYFYDSSKRLINWCILLNGASLVPTLTFLSNLVVSHCQLPNKEIFLHDSILFLLGIIFGIVSLASLTIKSFTISEQKPNDDNDIFGGCFGIFIMVMILGSLAFFVLGFIWIALDIQKSLEPISQCFINK